MEDAGRSGAADEDEIEEREERAMEEDGEEEIVKSNVSNRAHSQDGDKIVEEREQEDLNN